MAFTVYLISFILFSYYYALFVLTYGPNCPNRSRNFKNILTSVPEDTSADKSADVPADKT